MFSRQNNSEFCARLTGMFSVITLAMKRCIPSMQYLVPLSCQIGADGKRISSLSTRAVVVGAHQQWGDHFKQAALEEVAFGQAAATSGGIIPRLAALEEAMFAAVSTGDLAGHSPGSS